MKPIRIKLIKIGNSLGIRIPKHLIDKANLGKEVEIAVHRGYLVIRSVSHPRQGWVEQFRAMAEHGDDQLLETPVPTKWDRSDWV